MCPRHGVNEDLLKEMDTIASAWVDGARAYVCGNREFSQAVGRAGQTIVDERLKMRKAELGWSEEEVERRKAKVLESFNERAADDVFD